MRKPGRPSKLTAEIHEGIVAKVHAGAFPYVAAQAMGVSPRTFYRWMSDGEAGRRPFRQFWQDVRAAAAEARATAEEQVRRTDPFRWLRYGPGRERPGEPGWTESTQVSGPDGGPICEEVHYIAVWGDDRGEDGTPESRGSRIPGCK
jgi:hypothetical protein